MRYVATRMMQMLTAGCVVICLLAASASAQNTSFSVTPTLSSNQGKTILTVTFGIPEKHHIYEDMIAVTAISPEGVTLEPIFIPKPKSKFDQLLGKDVSYYDVDVSYTYAVSGLETPELTVQIAYQGCNETTCFLPQRKNFVVRLDAVTTIEENVSGGKIQGLTLDKLQTMADRFRVMGTGTGYKSAPKFLEFLKKAAKGEPEANDIIRKVFDRFGLALALLVVIPLGLLLNLTPCVLPMIPVNLAIIGAGAQSGSKTKGFLMGGLYGLGMALVYGILGIVVVLTGSKFGTLNASPWFNFAICAIFIALALAMFDVFVVDFSRFQKSGPTSDSTDKAPYITALLLGGMAALLAGACVAPVLISVLLLATDLYTAQNPLGLLLPFALGIGMALPWPFAGAGLSFLPKPGGWMNHVKHAFGILILLFALYYAKLGVQQLRTDNGDIEPQNVEELQAGWETSLEKGFQRAISENKPIFLDFWALSCKSCIKMKKTTFSDPDVTAALEPYVRIKFQTDNTDDPIVTWATDNFEVLGLPTYLVLQPKQD